MPGAVKELPYSPVPTDTEQIRPAPEISVSAPLSAFGSAQAEATKQLGGAIDKIGDEIYQRAQGMQKIKNEADARQAYVNMAQEGQQLYEDYASKGGAQAGPDQLKAFQDGMLKLRDKYRGQMTNVDAAHEFDSYSTSELVRLGNLAAGHAARELKSYNDSTRQAVADQARTTALGSPTDLDVRQKSFDAIDKMIDDNNVTAGLSPEAVQVKKDQEHSKLVAESLKVVARENPTLALTMFQRDTDSKVLKDPEAGAVKEFIDRENNRHTSRNLAHSANDGTLLGQDKVDITRAKQAIGPGLETAGKSDAASYDAKNPTSSASGKYQVLSGTFEQYKSAAGLGGMTFAQFKKDPAAQEKFFESTFGGFMEKYGSFSAAATAWHLGEGALAKRPDGTWARDPNFRGAGWDADDAYVAQANRALAKASTSQQVEASARGAATKLDPNNAELQDLSAGHAKTQYDQEKETTRLNRAATRETVDNEILKQINAGGMVSIDTLKNASPEVAAAVEKSDLLEIQSHIHTAMQKDNEWSDARETNANRLLGMAYSGDPEFKKVDPWKIDLTADARTGLLNLHKQAVAGKEIRDPELVAAQQSPAIKEKLDGYDSETKNQFWGAMSTVMKAARATGKPFDANDTAKLADQLMEKQGNSFLYKHFGIGGEETFRTISNVPDDYRGRFTKDYSGKFGRTPSEETIAHSYAVYLFNSSLGGKQDANK